jgi:hypothetical protein
MVCDRPSGILGREMESRHPLVIVSRIHVEQGDLLATAGGGKQQRIAVPPDVIEQIALILRLEIGEEKPPADRKSVV